MVSDTSEIKVGWQMNTVVGTFEILHLYIGYKEARINSLTMLCGPNYGCEGKVDKNS